MKKKDKRASLRARAVEISAEINSAMKKRVLTVASDPQLQVVKIPTPSLTINRVTGGGFALGRHVELYGDPNVGKSHIMYGTMALSQQRGNLCGLVDPEGVFDPEWFTHLGGFPDELIYERPDNAEEVIGALRLMVEKSLEDAPIEVVGIDSVAALVTKEQVEKDPREEERVASQARMMSRALRILTTRNKRILFIWTNQERDKVNLMFGGNPRTQPGGRALSFYATTRIEMKKTGQVTEERSKAEKGSLKKKKVKTGDWIQVRAEKEKSARPYMTGAYIFDADRGEIDLASEVIQLGLEDEIIRHVGNKYVYETFDGETVDHTMKGWRNRLGEDDELKSELIDAINDMTYQLAKVDDG